MPTRFAGKGNRAEGAGPEREPEPESGAEHGDMECAASKISGKRMN